jgi:glycosyltransferase involved in cell wall biosynthesis
MTAYTKGKISVVIISYNHATFILDAIKSVQSQNINDLEIIVADDASTDGTADIIKELAKSDDRVIPLLAEINRGISKNLNVALKRVKGEYIATLGGDDMMLPGKLARQFVYMKDNPDCGICCHDVEVFDSGSGKTLYRFNENSPVPQTFAENLFFTNWFFKKRRGKLCASTNFARSDYYIQNLFDEQLTYYNEALHGILNYAKSPDYKLGFINEVLGRYRIHPNNISRQPTSYFVSIREQMITQAIVQSKHPELFKKINDAVSFYLFQFILYKQIPGDKIFYFERIFLQQAGIIKYAYLKFCKNYLKLRGM